MSYLIFFFFQSFAFSQSTAENIYKIDSLKLYDSLQWQRLLHFEGSRSKVQKVDFYLTKNIKASARDEMVAALEQLLSPQVINKDHVLCRFPARALFLEEQLKIEFTKKLRSCEALQKFIDRSDLESVSVVFSSYYLHNPSSAFGHTLLKLNRKASDDNELMDYGINYSATVDTSNSIIYAFKGIFGLFKGEFTSIPYYYKIREYNDYESRDLWSYQLALTEREKQYVLYHVWEVGSAWAPYYYLDENCSYWVLRVIEASGTRLQLTETLPPTHVIPIDTIHALLKNKDLVESYFLRPSLRKKVLHRFKDLNSQQKNTVMSLVYDLSDKGGISAESIQKSIPEAKELDSALDYFDYLNARMAFENEPLFEAKKRPLLVARSRVKEKATLLDFSHELAPHFFHPSGMLSVTTGVTGLETSFYSFRWKPALHDLVDPHWGFDAASEINFFDVEVYAFKTLNDDWELKLRRFDLVRVGVMTPFDILDQKISWRFSLGVHQLSQDHPDRLRSLYFSIAPGLSLNIPGSKDSFVYFLFHSQADYHRQLSQDFALRVGPNVGTVIAWSDVFKTTIDAKYSYENQWRSQWDEYFIASLQTQYYFKNINWALAIEAEQWKTNYEYGLSLKRFF